MPKLISDTQAEMLHALRDRNYTTGTHALADLAPEGGRNLRTLCALKQRQLADRADYRNYQASWDQIALSPQLWARLDAWETAHRCETCGRMDYAAEVLVYPDRRTGGTVRLCGGCDVAVQAALRPLAGHANSGAVVGPTEVAGNG